MFELRVMIIVTIKTYMPLFVLKFDGLFPVKLLKMKGVGCNW